MGTMLVNVSAVYVVVLSLLKMVEKIEVAISQMKEKDDKKNRRNMLLVAFKLAAFFDFLYSAIISDHEMIFWKREPDEVLTNMFKRYHYEVPHDIDKHLEDTALRLEGFDYMVAVASKGLSSGSLFKQVFNSIKFALRYRDKQKSSLQARFFMTVFKEKTIMRMMKFSELDIVKAQAKKGLKKIELDK